MGTQTSKTAMIQPCLQLHADGVRLRKLRRNHTDSLFTAMSSITHGKSEALADMNSYKSPSCTDLHEELYLEIAESPNNLIRAYKEIKGSVQRFEEAVAREEYESISKVIDDFMLELEECTVFELKHTLMEKTSRLKLAMHEKVANGNTQSLAQLEHPLEFKTQRDEFIKEMFVVFMAFTQRLDAVKIRMIEYYGDDQSEECAAILTDLQAIMDEVRAVTDKGDLRVIVTREEYEDYIKSLEERFGRLVQTNKRQTETPRFITATANSIRSQRFINNANLI